MSRIRRSKLSIIEAQVLSTSEVVDPLYQCRVAAVCDSPLHQVLGCGYLCTVLLHLASGGGQLGDTTSLPFRPVSASYMLFELSIVVTLGPVMSRVDSVCSLCIPTCASVLSGHVDSLVGSPPPRNSLNPGSPRFLPSLPLRATPRESSSDSFRVTWCGLLYLQADHI